VAATTAALNRPDGQVPTLTGGAFTVTMGTRGGLRVGLEAELTASKVAVHRSFLALAVMQTALGPKLLFDGRVALGVTHIDFEEQSFLDILASDVRLSAGLAFPLSPQLAIVAHPVVLDFVSGRDLGGPIFSWPLRIGLTYGWGHPTR
jgi:hypothetical protein